MAVNAFATGLDHPRTVYVLPNGDVLVAETTHHPSLTTAKASADLPAGTINHHWTKDLTASPDGDKLYATVGSSSNVGENGTARLVESKAASGYKVIFVPFAGGMPSGKPQDVLSGFLNDKGEAQGRPVGVRIDKHGALLVADDVGNTVWRVTPSSKSAAVK